MSLHKIATKKESFSLSAPEAKSVSLVGCFTGWEPINLKKQKNGIWKGSIPLEPGAYEYRFVVDGQWLNDPNCNERVPNPFGDENCRRIVG